MGDRKRSDYEINMIVNQICVLLIKGITRRADIFQYISKMDQLKPKEQKKRNWVPVGDKTDRMIDIYIKRAREQLVEMAKDESNSIRALYVAQLEDMYMEARKKGNLQTANNIMKNKIFLNGLGGMNIKGNFSVTTFDVDLTAEEEQDYKNRLKDMYGEDLE